MDSLTRDFSPERVENEEGRIMYDFRMSGEQGDLTCLKDFFAATSCAAQCLCGIILLVLATVQYATLPENLQDDIFRMLPICGGALLGLAGYIAFIFTRQKRTGCKFLIVFALHLATINTMTFLITISPMKILDCMIVRCRLIGSFEVLLMVAGLAITAYRIFRSSKDLLHNSVRHEQIGNVIVNHDHTADVTVQTPLPDIGTSNMSLYQVQNRDQNTEGPVSSVFLNMSPQPRLPAERELLYHWT